MKKSLIAIIALFSLVSDISAQDSDLVLKKVMLYGSGVGYYEFEGNLDKESKIDLFFTQEQINDVLKSITITSKSVNSLQFDYDPLNAHYKILDGLRIDPSKAATISDLLMQQRGVDIKIQTDQEISGKILSVNRRDTPESGDISDESISILSDGKIITLWIDEIKSFSFADESLNEELKFALETMIEAQSQLYKKLTLNIKSSEKNSAKLGYVIASPVWKISYRLYAKDKDALFQAWAIVENDTTSDWNDVNLVLMTGKPKSFVQDLYNQFNPMRHILNADGTSQLPITNYDNYTQEQNYGATKNEHALSDAAVVFEEAQDAKVFLGSDVFTADVKDGAAEQFSFAVSKPVTLKKSKSMMIPLVSTEIPAEKFSLFSDNIPMHKDVNPKLALELKNTSNIKLPAGAITLYDTEGYMGDAFLDYTNINDNKIIAFGDDLGVKGVVTTLYKSNLQSLSIKKGLITLRTKSENIFTYDIKNLDTKPKNVVIEYKIQDPKSTITAKIEPYKKTPTHYRYKLEIPESKSSKFEIISSIIHDEQYLISELDDSMFAYYSSQGEIPKNVKDKFNEIALKKADLNKLERDVETLQNKQETLFLNQERSRKNLEAVGSESSEGKQFLNQILEQDKAIDAGYKNIEKLTDELKIQRVNFEQFLESIDI